MTSDALAITTGLLIMGGIVAQVTDYVMTVTALDKGKVEVGPINSLVVKKWGKNALAIATPLEVLAVLAIEGVFCTFGMLCGAVYAGTFLAAMIANIVRNIIRNK